MPDTLNIYEFLMSLPHFVKALVMDPKQSTGRYDLNSALFTVTKDLSIINFL